MKLQYISDLHLERDKNFDFIMLNPIKPIGDILILAGDILPFNYIDNKKYKKFFDYLSNNFDLVYWIPGNHEYWGYDIATKFDKIKDTIRENVFLVNNYNIQFANNNFIFSTLWTYVNPNNRWTIERNVHDFKSIEYDGYNFSVDKLNLIYENNLNFIQNSINNDMNNIIVTHHVPTYLNYPKEYKGDMINEAFVSEQFDLISNNNITHWIYGHHHNNVEDFVIGNSILHTNQLGYNKFENCNLEKYFEI